MMDKFQKKRTVMVITEESVLDLTAASSREVGILCKSEKGSGEMVKIILQCTWDVQTERV
jgi:hypothetical protein